MTAPLPFSRPARASRALLAEVQAQPGDATARIQEALDASRGGAVRLGPGLHQCGGLFLRSQTDLVLAEGAVLAASADYQAFAGTVSTVMAEDSDRAFILAREVEDAGIFGPGLIDGGSEAWHSGLDPTVGAKTPLRLRPRPLVAEGCRGLDLVGFRIVNSPLWTVHLIGSSDVVVQDLTIANDLELPNNDGIVVDSCQYVLVSGCRISTADDGVCLKTSRRPDGETIGPCVGVTVTGCTVTTRSCALKIGTESHADITDVLFARCLVPDANRGLGIFSRDGGAILRVRFEDITLDCRETPVGFWGSGEPLTISVLDRTASRPAGEVSGVMVRGLTGQAEGAIVLYAERPGGVHDVRLHGISLHQREGRLGTATMCDLRPTRVDRAVPQGATGRPSAWVRLADGSIAGPEPYPGGLSALFLHGVSGLDLQELTITRPEPLPPGWNTQSVLRAGLADEP